MKDNLEPLPQIHPREDIVRRAELDLMSAWIDIRMRHNLTNGESLSVVERVLGDDIRNRAKYMIRIERHGDPSKPGGTI